MNSFRLNRPPGNLSVSNLGKKYCDDYLLAARSTVRDMFNPWPSNKLKENEFYALQNIGFELKSGDCLGVTGPPKSGKSTLLSLLGKHTRPTTGSIRTFGKVTYLRSFNLGLKPAFTLFENMIFQLKLVGASQKDLKKSADRIFKYADAQAQRNLFLNRVDRETLRKLHYAFIANLKSDILILDGTLPPLNNEFGEKCLGQLAENQKKSILIFSSHQDALVERLATHLIRLDKGICQFFGDKSELIFSSINHGPEPSPKSQLLKKVEKVDTDHAKNTAKIKINGENFDYETLCLWLKPGENISVRASFIPTQEFMCSQISLQLHAPFQQNPAGIKFISLNTNGLKLTADKECSVEFTFRVPELQKGVFGLAFTLIAPENSDIKNETFKVVRFGVQTSEPYGHSTVLQVPEFKILNEM